MHQSYLGNDFCREILGPSIQHPVLSGSVAPVTEMENAEGVNWEINDPDYYRKVLIRMTWDDFDGPSVLAPLGDFFCIGHSMPSSFRQFLLMYLQDRVRN